MTLELYALKFSPPCWSVTHLMDHMGLEYEVHEVDILSGQHLEEDFVKVTRAECSLIGPQMFDQQISLRPAAEPAAHDSDFGGGRPDLVGVPRDYAVPGE